MDAPLAQQGPGEASARVVESAVALLRAELRLFVSYTKAVLERAFLSLLLGWIAMTCGQLAVALVVLSPLLSGLRPWPNVLLSIALGIALGGAAVGAAIWAARSARKVGLEATNSSGDERRARPRELEQ